ncbi:MAG: tetratricopeptide repeat protein [Bacteroidia bacterium]|nr:tetratricopeptide repeat protein [Bacteroidia bacterium]
MKKTIILSAIAFTGFLNAQTLQEAVTKTENERFAAAAVDFRALIAKDAGKGENYYYYGENFFKNDQIDSANIFYAKGAEVNATYPLNYVGQGKVLLTKGNVAEAKTLFYKAIALGANKNAELLRKVAEAWLATDTKNADEALLQINAAIKLEPKNPENYIILGDAQLEKNPTDGSGPIKSYKQATTLNPKNVKGILREGKLYQRGRNYQLGVDKYKEAIAIDPTFAPAHRAIAEVYSLAGQPAKAIESWKKYLELNNSDDARYKFMSDLYLNKQYLDATTEYEGLLKQNFKSVYTHRLAGYSYYENGKGDTLIYRKGINAINKFFELAGPNFKYLYGDYRYKGLLLAKLGKDSLAVLEMEKAIALDPSASGELNTEIANIYMKAKKYDKAIKAFERKMNGDLKNLNNNDFYSLGRAYYYSGGNVYKEAALIKDAKAKEKKEQEAKPFFISADSAFSQLTRLNPTWPVGYFWRGKANSYIDPTSEKGLAKPHFENALSKLKPEEKTSPTYKNNVIEALEYLGGYHTSVAKDKAKADEYWKQVQEIDPANQKAKIYFNPPKQAPKKP